MLVAIYSNALHLQQVLQQLNVGELQFVTLTPGQAVPQAAVASINDEPKCYLLHSGFNEDTCLIKPTHINDLARVLLMKLRECHYKLGNMIFHPWRRVIIIAAPAEETLALTEKESDIIHYLVKKRDSGASKKELLNNIWGYNESAETGTVETHVYRLRNKLSAQGVGELILSGDNGYYLSVV